MVEVFDAHLAASAAPPRGEVPAPAPVPLLAGPEPLVSSLRVAQALRRRHTGILRIIDALAAERPELVGGDVRFATYLHENRRPYRCFHLTRAGFVALMAQIPCSDLGAAALRDSTLAGWPEAAASAGSRDAAPMAPGRDAPPAAFAPRVDHDGFAVMRLAGETLVVDLTRVEPGRPGRAVVFGWDRAVRVVDLAGARSNARFLGTRNVTLPDPTDAGAGRRSVWIVGGVVAASQPTAAPGREAGAPPRAAKPRRPCGALPAAVAASARADLAEIEVCGRA